MKIPLSQVCAQPSLAINFQKLSNNYIVHLSCPSGSAITLMEFFPPFSLYRIIYELSPPPATGFYSDFSGVQLGDLSNPENGILVLLIIMVLEWATFLFLTLYWDEFGCLQNVMRSRQALQKPSTQPQKCEASIEIDRTDIMREVRPKSLYMYVLSCEP